MAALAGGVPLPAVSEPAGWRLRVGRFECSVCGRQASVTAGTIFDKTRTPLRLWFEAAWLMTSQKHGVSALGVQRALGLGSYQTAWAMLHRFRVAMVRPGRDRLGGHVEVDETYVGGVEEGVVGRETTSKSIVAIAVEIRNPRGFGRVRMQSVPDVSKDSLTGFVGGAIEPGTTVHTDGWPAYLSLPEHGYEHERTVMSARSDPAHVVMPGVHRIASLLKRWLLGTHQGRVSPEHLDAYLNEFTFRLTAGARDAEDCCSTGCSSKPCLPSRSGTGPWSRDPAPARAPRRSTSRTAAGEPPFLSQIGLGGGEPPT